MQSAWVRGLVMVALCSAATPAAAAWQKASSRHFIIYSDDRPDRLQAFADHLERYDAAVREVRGMNDPDPGDNNRVTIFVLPDASAVAALLHNHEPNAAGFYTPRSSGSVAFVPRQYGVGTQSDLSPQIILFHEYAHHLMFEELEQAYPSWFVEGFAEFMSTATIGKDGSVGIGLPAIHRARSLARMSDVSVADILAAARTKPGSELREQTYAKGWLLTHYLTFEPSRKGQLADYLTRFAKGAAPLDAAQQAFGDLKQLDRDLESYLHRSRMSYVDIAASRLHVSSATVTALSPAAAAIMPSYIRLRRGLLDKDRPAVAETLRAAAARTPGDPLVEQAVAEVEGDSGNGPAAAAAADRAIAADPRSPRAWWLKGMALLRSPAGTRISTAQASEARKAVMAANKLDTEDPEPLLLFYQSYVRSGQRPTANAIAGLHYAAELAPQDPVLRTRSAIEHWRAGEAAAARKELLPVAYNPHGGQLSEVARALLTQIDQKQAAPSLPGLEAAGKADQ